jgi:hypothetical protein
MQVYLFSVLLLVTFISFPVSGYARSGPQGISDIVVALDESSNESTIYLTDELSHGIYQLAVAHADVQTPKESPLSDFKLFFESPQLSNPSGIGYYNGKLFV